MADFIYTPPTDPWLDIIHEDKDIIVLNKPSGLLSIPGRQAQYHDSIYSRVLERFPNSHIVHRLDMATSGVIVVALRRNAERELKRQFRDRETAKTYYARVAGHVSPAVKQVDYPLICDWPNRPKQKVDHLVGKPSLTHVEVVSYGKKSTLVKLTPITGRSHQLRVHMMAIGHPILGDGFYADPWAKSLSNRLLLHAAELTIKHPYHQTPLTFNAEVPFITPLDTQ
ncbi:MULTISPECIES: bifunctional tRNA pseudouridine(32) synthase/23S rRNA pseudouridine(746) synthase RluA [unclassified Shewanella]|uniref:bifunctional tRNA pseudouridine(32) synthase/23S rRNA pseudouridine(746) synthase RluA n=1 Tax=unclassified Shewanella TaxID=196818 RepID=UPI000C83D6D3|nr:MULTISPECIES: bifunctional tRNA pseudouridine(32) synthase/23S rRNA pseudouridine(746) synthase RluA [unclassified Shewanella]MDO6620301.1 bifunctional tRNA pseudouridine(32) synthase/23S rRNA pseudouridine(746) synthase RluA [Shewanella sp. 6_MG-2023]MDO6679505.1 bifunctional tRNA pseudouridine(32) synthase/23S rRNA pseudouridine(746) synthase RluA [Shewanella sp. 4_MG-2023]MDO6774592.1 bifunctional tRNA pseudouridine(32) synthase/23S rRNA pseudouridine(746) synthase RluA [Shewanella sp. 3_M